MEIHIHTLPELDACIPRVLKALAGRRKIALMLSSVLIVVALVALPTFGLNFGLDFTGGTEVELRFDSAPEIADVRDSLDRGGIADAVVQTFGSSTEFLVRIPPSENQEQADQQASQVLEALQVDYADVIVLLALTVYPLLDGAEVVAEMQLPRRLNT